MQLTRNKQPYKANEKQKTKSEMKFLKGHGVWMTSEME